MPEPTEPPTYCTRKPTPGAFLSDGCSDCGHAIILHVGVDHCPVCELVDLSQQARANAVTSEQVMRGEKSINDYRAARGLPPTTINVTVEGSALDEAELRHVVETEMRRLSHGRFRRRTTLTKEHPMSAITDRFHQVVTQLEAEGHHLADEARTLFAHYEKEAAAVVGAVGPILDDLRAGVTADVKAVLDEAKTEAADIVTRVEAAVAKVEALVQQPPAGS